MVIKKILSLKMNGRTAKSLKLEETILEVELINPFLPGSRVSFRNGLRVPGSIAG